MRHRRIAKIGASTPLQSVPNRSVRSATRQCLRSGRRERLRPVPELLEDAEVDDDCLFAATYQNLAREDLGPGVPGQGPGKFSLATLSRRGTNREPNRGALLHTTAGASRPRPGWKLSAGARKPDLARQTTSQKSGSVCRGGRQRKRSFYNAPQLVQNIIKPWPTLPRPNFVIAKLRQ